MINTNKYLKIWDKYSVKVEITYTDAIFAGKIVFIDVILNVSNVIYSGEMIGASGIALARMLID